MTFAGAASARSYLAGRLDISNPGCSTVEIDTPTIRRHAVRRYCPAGYKIDACSPSRSRKSEPGCPGAPLVYPVGDWIRTRLKLRRRHQDGVDHVDHAVRLVDVRDRDRRSAALGIDDRHRAARLLDGQLFAFNGLELLAVGQAGGLQPSRNHVIGQDFGQGWLVLRLHQGVDRAGRQLAECGVGRREHSERALAFRVSTRPAAFTAATSVVWSLEFTAFRSEEHTSELQSLTNLVCRLLLEKKK